jgi:hypothetical protein
MNKKIMTAAALLLTASCLAAAAAEGTARTVLPVSTDPRVELMSVIFRLAGNNEYARSRIPSYDADTEKHFAPFKEHPAVKYAAELKEKYGVSYDAVMAMAIHVTGAASLGEKVPFEPRPAGLDGRWNPETARKFLALTREFVKDTKFEEFYAAHKPLYELAARRLQETLDKGAHLEWFDSFFGPVKDADFRIAIGMLNGGGNYGGRVALPGGRKEMYSIIGVWRTDADGNPVFPDGVVSTVVHEFTHSYTNPLVDRFKKDLEPAGKKIFPLVEQQMRSQAYGNWETLMYESLNRACELRYDRVYYSSDAVKRAEEYEISRGFHWVPGLGEVLGEYDAAPRKYKDLGEFFPKIVEYFNAYAGRAEADIAAYNEKKKAEAEKKRQEMESWKEKGPKVVAMSPENGAADVPAGPLTITITFDRPMGEGYSMVQTEGRDRYPKIKEVPGFDAGRKVFSMQVELQPGREYVIGVNSEDYSSFKSAADGVPLYPVKYTFKTKP